MCHVAEALRTPTRSLGGQVRDPLMIWRAPKDMPMLLHGTCVQINTVAIGLGSAGCKYCVLAVQRAQRAALQTGNKKQMEAYGRKPGPRGLDDAVLMKHGRIAVGFLWFRGSHHNRDHIYIQACVLNVVRLQRHPHLHWGQIIGLDSRLSSRRLWQRLFASKSVCARWSYWIQVSQTAYSA